MRLLYPLTAMFFYVLGWASAIAGFKYDKLLLLLLFVLFLILVFFKREDLEMLDKFYGFVKKQEGKQ